MKPSSTATAFARLDAARKELSAQAERGEAGLIALERFSGRIDALIQQLVDDASSSEARLFVIRERSLKGPAEWCGTSRSTIRRCSMIETCEPLSHRRAHNHASAFHDGGASSSQHRPSADRDARCAQSRREWLPGRRAGSQPVMVAGATDRLWDVEDLVVHLENGDPS
jgi:hypothetical protein